MNATGNHAMGSTIPGNVASGDHGLSAFSASIGTPSGVPGMDVSGWQVLNSGDWRNAYDNGARFAYVKATEGTDYTSSQFNEQYNDSFSAGFIRGAYHFATPDTSSGATQANYFVNNGGGWSADGQTLPPLLDIEYNPYGATCYGLSQSAMVSWIGDFSNTVLSRTGRLPAIYSTTDWWTQCTGNSSAFSANPLFIARYPSNIASGAGTLPAGWSNYTFWQWSDSGVFPGDQDVFNGSTTDLSSLAIGRSYNIVQGQGRSEVYLIAGGMKHHIPTIGDLLVYMSRLGGIASVPASYIDSLPTGGDATRYVQDTRIGALYLLQQDGTKHHFKTFQDVQNFGYAPGSYTNLDSSEIDAFTTGPEVGNVFSIDGGSNVYTVQNGSSRYIPDLTSLLYALRSQGSMFIASMAADSAAKLSSGRLYLAPNSLVTLQGDSKVYMALGDHYLIYLPSFDTAADFGSFGYDVLAAGSYSSLSILPGSLSTIVTCATSTYIASGGLLYPLSGSNVGGQMPVKLSDDACSYMSKSSTTLSAPLFIQSRSAAEVYQLINGQRRHVVHLSTLVSLNGPRPLNIIYWYPGVVSAIPEGGPLFADGDFVQFTGHAEVYLYQAGTLRHVETMPTLLQLGGGVVPPITFVPASNLSQYTIGTPIH